MRRLGWAILLTLLAALLAGALTFDKRSWPVFAGDEATYLMLGESLAWDRDIHYTAADYARFSDHWQRPPEGLILQSSDGGRSLTYGKPALYSLAIAPFLRLSPVRGAAIANAIYLAIAACFAARALRQGAEDAAPWLVAAFVFASVAFAHVFWAHPDLFLMDLVAVALALAYGGETPSGPQFDDRGERRAVWRWFWSGALFGAVVACRPFYAALLLPAAAAIPRPARRRGWAALAAGAALALLTTVGADLAARGFYTSYGAERLSFDSASGFPAVSPQARSWSERIAARGGPGSWVAPDRLLPYRFDGRLWSYDGLYLLAGRDVGLLPYFMPAALGLLLYRPGRGRSLLVVAVLLVAAGFFAVRPFNFYGGGGALGNRYLLPVYPAFWFLAARAARPRLVVALALCAAPFLWPLWRAPRAFPWTPEGGYRYVSNFARRLLPYETTQSHLKPGGAEDFVHHGLWVKPLGTETRAVAGGEAIGCFHGNAPWCGELLVGSERPLTALRLRQASGTPLRVRTTGGVVASVPAEGSLRLALGEPYARHAMWWQAPNVYLYRLVLEGPESAAFEIEGSS